MQSIQKTRFIAANYSNLQGLKALPLGLLLLIVVIWANSGSAGSNDLGLPLLVAAGSFGLYWLIQRYYRVRFGQVERTPRQKRMELIVGFAGGLVALAAFALDTSFKLPFSIIGLVFAAAVIADYLRMQWYARGHYLLPGALVSSAILLVVSFLPLLGAGEWWRLLGLRSQIFGALLSAAVIIIANGLLGHWFFIRHLPGKEQ